MAKQKSKLIDIFTNNEQEILEDWMREQIVSITYRKDLLTEAELRSQSAELGSDDRRDPERECHRYHLD